MRFYPSCHHKIKELNISNFHIFSSETHKWFTKPICFCSDFRWTLKRRCTHTQWNMLVCMKTIWNQLLERCTKMRFREALDSVISTLFLFSFFLFCSISLSLKITAPGMKEEKKYNADWQTHQTWAEQKSPHLRLLFENREILERQFNRQFNSIQVWVLHQWVIVIKIP